MKIVHAADLHLDSPLAGLERYDGAPAAAIRGASRRALENLVELCLGEDARLLLVAGDVYDGDWKDYSTGLFFARQMARLGEAGVAVVMVRGNHDAASVITRNLRLPGNVTELDSVAPQTLELEDLSVAVHGQSYPRRSVTEDLASAYPEAVEGAFNIAVLHTAASGRPGHESYAPCRLETLRNKGHDYWALGHVHTREVLAEDPWIVFPGNLQGRHMRETGAKGATVVTVDDRRVSAVEHRPLDVARFDRIEVDAAGAAGFDEVLERARAGLEQGIERAEGRLLAVRVVIAGPSPAHAVLSDDPERLVNEVRVIATEAGGDALWIERVELRTRDLIDLPALAAREDAIGQIARGLAELADDPEELAGLGRELADLAHKLPVELRTGPGGLRLDDPDHLRRALADVEQMLLPLLVAAEEDAAP